MRIEGFHQGRHDYATLQLRKATTLIKPAHAANDQPKANIQLRGRLKLAVAAVAFFRISVVFVTDRLCLREVVGPTADAVNSDKAWPSSVTTSATAACRAPVADILTQGEGSETPRRPRQALPPLLAECFGTRRAHGLE